MQPKRVSLHGKEEFLKLPKTTQQRIMQEITEAKSYLDQVIVRANNDIKARAKLGEKAEPKTFAKAGQGEDIIPNGHSGGETYNKGVLDSLEKVATIRVKRVMDDMHADQRINYPDKPKVKDDAYHLDDRDQAGHAEKKAFEEARIDGHHPSVAVSRPPCSHCIDYFQARAQHLKRDIIIADPGKTTVFRSDGEIFELPHD